ncbi:MAG: polymer-forming cytoskeletal protein [Bacteroidales bacterium]|jgi:cytoskeletal protein CcmA (bactofilin family)|nr:polymer-forming cytoskeletal protein [Bacteroidales bacterium]MDD4529122.1 polymer-forming cytoskeletal protein [Bacteroidales bacterium]MDD4829297.1 polymer-forming cytoskeletal protein [Bacteroidales bacterium]
MAKTNYEQDSTNAINIISNRTTIKGDVISDGDLRIDGIVEGSLNIKGKLVIGNSGKIVGNINCQNADLSGRVEGNIIVKDLLSLQNNSTINGDITIGKLSIEPGATFTGKCSMSTNSPKPNSETIKLNTPNS